LGTPKLQKQERCEDGVLGDFGISFSFQLQVFLRELLAEGVRLRMGNPAG